MSCSARSRRPGPPQIQAEFAAVAGVEVLVPIVLTVPALIIGLMAPFAGAIADRSTASACCSSRWSATRSSDGAAVPRLARRDPRQPRPGRRLRGRDHDLRDDADRRLLVGRAAQPLPRAADAGRDPLRDGVPRARRSARRRGLAHAVLAVLRRDPARRPHGALPVAAGPSHRRGPDRRPARGRAVAAAGRAVPGDAVRRRRLLRADRRALVRPQRPRGDLHRRDRRHHAVMSLATAAGAIVFGRLPGSRPGSCCRPRSACRPSAWWSSSPRPPSSSSPSAP